MKVAGTLPVRDACQQATNGSMVKLRNAVRAIIITPRAEVLLMRIRLGCSGDGFWITPGGGIEAGETVETCLRRELNEELGLTQFDIGPLVWRREHTFNWEHQRIRQSEWYHVIRVDRFEPKMSDASRHPAGPRCMPAIRQALVSEVPRLADLAASKREEYATYSPIFWRPAPNAGGNQIPSFEQLVR